MDTSTTSEEVAGVAARRTTPHQREARDGRAATLLAVAAHTRDPQRRHDLLDQVVVEHMPVARWLARRFLHRGIDKDDLEQVAYMALVRAVDNYDPDRDHSLLAFAVPTIRGELKKYFRDHGWTVRPPRRIQELQGPIREANDRLQQERGRAPTCRELAADLDVSEDAVVEALATDGCFHPTSIDRPIGPDPEMSLQSLVGMTDTGVGAAEARVMLAPLVRALPRRDRLILQMRFFEDLTQREIGEAIGVTQMQVSRLLQHILDVLRDQIERRNRPSPDVEEYT